MRKYCTGPQREANFRDARAHRMHKYCTGPRREANFRDARDTRARIKCTNFAPRRSERPILVTDARAHDTRARIRCTKYCTAPQRETNFAKTGARRRARRRAPQDGAPHAYARHQARSTPPRAPLRHAVPHLRTCSKVGTAQGPQPLWPQNRARGRSPTSGPFQPCGG